MVMCQQAPISVIPLTAIIDCNKLVKTSITRILRPFSACGHFESPRTNTPNRPKQWMVRQLKGRKLQLVSRQRWVLPRRINPKASMPLTRASGPVMTSARKRA
jgi:hypothetical protein